MRCMVNTMNPIPIRQQVRRVLFITLFLNLMVALSKIIIGLWSGALSITADGFHSLVDGSSNVVALVANRIADRPPDADHPYGHRRFETVAALGIGAFLLLTAWQIVSSALARLSGGGEEATITPLSFAVMVGTLLVNVFVNTYESREGRRLRSELLIADAAHTRTDIFVTLSVLASMALIVMFQWQWVDTAAALVIVVLILRAAWGVLRQTGRVLVDTAPYEPHQLTQWVEELPCVERVIRARSRGPLDAAQIDIDVQVAAEMTAGQTAAITDAIRDQLSQKVDGLAEVEVHFVPDETPTDDYALLARARADALGLATHEVAVRDSERGKVLEMHVEVPPGQTLGVAHEQVSRLEQKVRAQLPELIDVVTHIEPATPNSDFAEAETSEHSTQLKAEMMRILQTEYPDADWHHLDLYPANGGFTAMMHVTLPSQISVEAAHRVAESAEILLRASFPYLERVTIHTEPPE
jgi:cation diffusion facilitator family transporter